MIKYVCRYCGKDDFLTVQEYERHELDHKIVIGKIARAPRGAIICPDCKGKGGYYGTYGDNWNNCYTCRGEGIIIPKNRNS